MGGGTEMGGAADSKTCKEVFLFLFLQKANTKRIKMMMMEHRDIIYHECHFYGVIKIFVLQ